MTTTMEAPRVETEEVNETQQDIREAIKLAKGLERSKTKASLGIARILVRAIEREVTGTAKSRDDVSDFRDQTIALFSRPLSRATGLSISAKNLSEYLKVHYMRTLVSPDTQERFDRLTWENLRVLTRWVTHQPNETLFEVGTDEDPGVYEEQWTIQEGCEEKLADLILSLSKRPRDRKSLVKILDDHERELSGKTDKVSDVGADYKARVQFLESIATRLDKLAISRAKFLEYLLDAKLLDLPTINAVMTAILAEQAAKPSKAAGKPGAPLDANGTVKPGSNPLIQPESRVVHPGK